MSVDPSVIAALEAAVDGDPMNPALRTHLAGLRLRAGDHTGALADARVVLVATPDDTAALAVARDAARLAGDDAQAESYGRVLAALQGLEPTELSTAAPAPEDDRPPAQRLHAGGPLGENEEDGDELDDGADGGDAALALGLAPTGARVTLRDVAGMTSVLERLELAFLGPLRNPELRELYGKSLRGGLLLYGPPGCGKTFLARAVAGELGAAFFAIGLNDVLDMWLGESEQRLHRIFDAARRQSFDRTVLVLPPDEPARAAILRRSLCERPTERVDADRIAARTDGCSGADLVHLVDVAVEHALADSIKTGSARPVTQKDVERACKEISPSTRPWFATAHNYALYANQDGTYDDLLTYIRVNKLL